MHLRTKILHLTEFSIYSTNNNLFNRIITEEAIINKKIIVMLILFLFFLTSSYGQTIMIRPSTSIGYLSSEDIKGLALNYGLKLLLPANEFQRFGILVNHLIVPDKHQVSYLCTGLMLEQVIFKYFNMGIGTIGFINIDQKGENPFGIYSHLGFEYKFAKNIHFIASYQCDFIFREHFTMFNAFQLGLGLQF